RASTAEWLVMRLTTLVAGLKADRLLLALRPATSGGPVSRAGVDPVTRSVFIPRGLAHGRAVGGDADELIRRFRLPPTAASDREVVLSLSAYHALLDVAEGATGDPFLGLHMADHFQKGWYGLPELTARLAPRVRDGLSRVARYFALVSDIIIVTYREEGDVGVVEHRIPGHPLCVGRHGNEFFVAALFFLGREATRAPCIPDRVWFAHPQPADIEPLVSALGTTNVQFGMGVNGFQLCREVLALRIGSADPPVLSILDRYAEEKLDGQPRMPRLTDQVRQRIRESLCGRECTLGGVAAALHLGTRTLQRRLAAEGTQFFGLVESVREEL